MRLSFLALLLCTLAPHSPAQDIHLQAASELSPDLFVNPPRVIHPGLTLYGVKWYSSPAEIVAAFGPPHGKMIYDRDTVGLLYGRSHTLVFEKNELREVLIASTLFNEPSRSPAAHPFFDGNNLTVEPGYWLLPFKAQLDEVLGAEGYDTRRLLALVRRGEKTFRYSTKFAAVELELIGYSDYPGELTELQIRQITIRGH